MELEGTYGGRCFSAGSASKSALSAGSGPGGRFAVLLFLLLPVRAPQKFAGVYAACHVLGVVGGADVVRAVPQPLRGIIRDGRALTGADPANAAGHFDGDGAL